MSRLPGKPGLLDRTAAAAWAESQRARGRRIVFTNGVFDIIHPGHVRYLADARALGDALIVAVNSDASVRRLEKGLERPINPERERAEVLAALTAVDAVVIFDDDTPHEIVTAIQPDVLAKGADWAVGTIVGADVVEARGGYVARIKLAEGYSTTRLVEKARR